MKHGGGTELTGKGEGWWAKRYAEKKQQLEEEK